MREVLIVSMVCFVLLYVTLVNAGNETNSFQFVNVVVVSMRKYGFSWFPFIAFGCRLRLFAINVVLCL